MPKRLLSPTVRRYVYGVAIAALPLVQVYGIVAEEHGALWAALVGAVLVPTLAAYNTPTKRGDRAAVSAEIDELDEQHRRGE